MFPLLTCLSLIATFLFSIMLKFCIKLTMKSKVLFKYFLWVKTTRKPGLNEVISENYMIYTCDNLIRFDFRSKIPIIFFSKVKEMYFLEYISLPQKTHAFPIISILMHVNHARINSQKNYLVMIQETLYLMGIGQFLIW